MFWWRRGNHKWKVQVSFYLSFLLECFCTLLILKTRIFYSSSCSFSQGLTDERFSMIWLLTATTLLRLRNYFVVQHPTFKQHIKIPRCYYSVEWKKVRRCAPLLLCHCQGGCVLIVDDCLDYFFTQCNFLGWCCIFVSNQSESYLSNTHQACAHLLLTIDYIFQISVLRHINTNYYTHIHTQNATSSF